MILAAAAGAVGVRLGGGSAPGLTPDRAKTFEAGAPPDSAGGRRLDARARRRSSATCAASSRLVWRSVVLWMLLLALLSLANLIG